MKRITKYLVSLAIVLTIAIAPLATSAITASNLGAENDPTNLQLGEKSPVAIVTSLLNTAMGFLGLVAVVIILLGGFKWMTAGGSEDKIGEAKKLMIAGIIGIVIILSAWGISKWVIETAITTTSGN